MTSDWAVVIHLTGRGGPGAAENKEEDSVFNDWLENLEAMMSRKIPLINFKVGKLQDYGSRAIE